MQPKRTRISARDHGERTLVAAIELFARKELAGTATLQSAERAGLYEDIILWRYSRKISTILAEIGVKGMLSKAWP